MRRLLKSYAERIDAASLRERALIFLALALGLVLLANAALLEPLRTKQKRLAAESTQRQEELKSLQREMQRLASAGNEDPDAANRQRRDALRAELESLNGQIGREQRRFTPPDRMRGVLEELLERNKRLALVDLKTLPATPMTVASAGGTAGAYRHGIELTVRGSYMDLYEYLGTLERLPYQLYWGRSELAVAEHPLITLKLTLYTVSFHKAWLIV
jgi:MSHA biogenesis protein MshJ